MAIRFDESFAQARSFKNAWTVLGNSTGSIRITVTDQELIVAPHTPLRWLFNGLALDMDHRIKLRDVKAVNPVGKILFYNLVAVEFHNAATNKDQSILLYVRDQNKFVKSLQP